MTINRKEAIIYVIFYKWGFKIRQDNNCKKIAREKGIPYLSLDWIMMGFTNGIPEYGVHDKLFPDEIAKRLWSILKAMFESMIAADTNCIIEGEALLPELIIELLTEFPDELRVCFLGYIDVELNQKLKEIRDFSHAKNDWLEDKSDAYIIDHVKNMIAHSKKIKKSCAENNIRYFDASENFNEVIQAVSTYIME